MRIVGVDLSLTRTGLCRVDVGPDYVDHGIHPEDIRCLFVASGPTAKNYRAISDRIRAVATEVTAVLKDADLVVIEGPSFASRNGQTHSRDWLWGRVYDSCVDLNIPVLVVTPSQRAKYATGKGNAPKDQVLAATIRRWPQVNVTGNDEADALILAAIGCRQSGVPIDDIPKGHYEPVFKNLDPAA